MTQSTDAVAVLRGDLDVIARRLRGDDHNKLSILVTLKESLALFDAATERAATVAKDSGEPVRLLREMLSLAVNQGEHDMLLTGDELRSMRNVLERTAGLARTAPTTEASAEPADSPTAADAGGLWQAEAMKWLCDLQANVEWDGYNLTLKVLNPETGRFKDFKAASKDCNTEEMMLAAINKLVKHEGGEPINRPAAVMAGGLSENEVLRDLLSTAIGYVEDGGGDTAPMYAALARPAAMGAGGQASAATQPAGEVVAWLYEWDKGSTIFQGVRPLDPSSEEYFDHIPPGSIATALVRLAAPISEDTGKGVLDEREDALIDDMDHRERAARTPAAPVGEVVLFGGDLKEVSWAKGKMPAPGTQLFATPAAPVVDAEPNDRQAALMDLQYCAGFKAGRIAEDENDQRAFDAIDRRSAVALRALKQAAPVVDLRAAIPTWQERVQEDGEQIDNKNYNYMMAEIADLRAALARHAAAELVASHAPSAPDWHAIDSAPKDGTTILLFAPAAMYEGKPIEPRVTAGQWTEWEDTTSEFHATTGEYLGQSVQDGGALWSSWDGGFLEELPPTHWMPLPPAPKEPDNE